VEIVRPRLVGDGVLSALLADQLGTPAPLRSRALLQHRWDNGRIDLGRTVELVTLTSGLRLVAKCRNDRPACRETFFYRHVLRRAGPLVPVYLGSGTTADGVHVLLLEYLAGRAVDWSAARERTLAMQAVADFHARFEGMTLAEICPALTSPPLAAEAVPDGLPAISPTQADPLVLDPGDIRPDNLLLTASDVVLIDFEAASVRPRSTAVASMLRTLPPAPGGTPLADYIRRMRAVSRFPRYRLAPA
jgi:hypothetical protein